MADGKTKISDLPAPPPPPFDVQSVGQAVAAIIGMLGELGMQGEAHGGTLAQIVDMQIKILEALKPPPKKEGPSAIERIEALLMEIRDAVLPDAERAATGCPVCGGTGKIPVYGLGQKEPVSFIPCGHCGLDAERQ